MAKRKASPLTIIKRNLKATRLAHEGNLKQKAVLENAQVELDNLNSEIPEQEEAIAAMQDAAMYLNGVDLGMTEVDPEVEVAIELLVTKLEPTTEEATTEVAEETAEVANEDNVAHLETAAA
jgi:hypothetical protein